MAVLEHAINLALMFSAQSLCLSDHARGTTCSSEQRRLASIVGPYEVHIPIWKAQLKPIESLEVRHTKGC